MREIWTLSFDFNSLKTLSPNRICMDIIGRPVGERGTVFMINKNEYRNF